MKSIGYIRVSSQEQSRDGTSLARQEALIIAEAKRQNWDTPVILRDEGISGGKPARRRPGFAALTAAVRSRAAEVVIVSDLSRLSRSQKDTLIFLEDIVMPSHAHLYAIDKGFIENTTVSGTMDLTLKTLMAEVYRKEISEKTRRAMAFKRQNHEKLGRDVPYGFQAIDTGGRRRARDGREIIIYLLVADAREQAVIANVQNEHREGRSLGDIARQLTSDGIPTKRGLSNWFPAQVQRLIARAI